MEDMLKIVVAAPLANSLPPSPTSGLSVLPSIQIKLELEIWEMYTAHTSVNEGMTTFIDLLSKLGEPQMSSLDQSLPQNDFRSPFDIPLLLRASEAAKARVVGGVFLWASLCDANQNAFLKATAILKLVGSPRWADWLVRRGEESALVPQFCALLKHFAASSSETTRLEVHSALRISQIPQIDCVMSLFHRKVARAALNLAISCKKREAPSTEYQKCSKTILQAADIAVLLMRDPQALVRAAAAALFFETGRFKFQQKIPGLSFYGISWLPGCICKFGGWNILETASENFSKASRKRKLDSDDLKHSKQVPSLSQKDNTKACLLLLSATLDSEALVRAAAFRGLYNIFRMRIAQPDLLGCADNCIHGKYGISCQLAKLDDGTGKWTSRIAKALMAELDWEVKVNAVDWLACILLTDVYATREPFKERVANPFQTDHFDCLSLLQAMGDGNGCRLGSNGVPC